MTTYTSLEALKLALKKAHSYAETEFCGWVEIETHHSPELGTWELRVFAVDSNPYQKNFVRSEMFRLVKPVFWRPASIKGKWPKPKRDPDTCARCCRHG